jgi:hypothetical protein
MKLSIRAALPPVLFLASACVLLLTAWVSDDAFITLRTVDNWRHGYGLTWNIRERVQTYTHPLWMFLLAGIHVFVPNGYFTALIAGLLISLTVVAIFIREHRGDALLLTFGRSAIPCLHASTPWNRTGENRIEDPSIAQYYDHLKIIVSGELWSWRRLDAFWKMNTGQYEHLLHPAQ